MIRSTLFLVLSALAMSCGSPSTPPQTPTPKPDPNPTPGQVDLSISSVTLADDCGQKPSQPPTAMWAQPPSAGDMGPRDPSMFASQAQRACEQSSVQIRVANGTGDSTKITVKKIEVLDDSGNVIGQLTPRDASQWSSDTYQPWDEQVAANSVIQVSYALSDPNVMRGGTYTLRVVIAAGDGERTIEQRTTLEAEASLPPGAVT